LAVRPQFSQEFRARLVPLRPVLKPNDRVRLPELAPSSIIEELPVAAQVSPRTWMCPAQGKCTHV
jgi:hypothetical protein